MPRVSLDFANMEGKDIVFFLYFDSFYHYIYLILLCSYRFKELNSVETRSFKATLNEKDGLAKVAMRDLPSTSNEKIQTDLKQKAKEILMKDVQLQSKILSKKSRKVQKEKTKSNALVNTVSFKSLRK